MPHAPIVWRKTRVIVVPCAQCGRKVRRYAPLHQKRAHGYFCSQQCHVIHRRTGLTLKCEHCGKGHYVQRRGVRQDRHHYCSQACFHAAHVVIVPCAQCGKPVNRARKKHDKAFCNFACYSAWRRAGLFQAWKASKPRAAHAVRARKTASAPSPR